jgi:hypothetical protein
MLLVLISIQSNVLAIVTPSFLVFGSCAVAVGRLVTRPVPILEKTNNQVKRLASPMKQLCQPTKRREGDKQLIGKIIGPLH